MNKFETLIDEKEIVYAKRWHPFFVDSFRKTVGQGVLTDINPNILSNIAYSLQYLQYLQLQMDELNLHSIVGCLLYKTYIITAMSIVEAVFNQVLKCTDKFPKTDGWECIRQVKSTEYEENEKFYRLETSFFVKSNPKDKQIDFNTTINRIKDKKLLDLESSRFPDIKKLQKLRNRVHLQIAEDSTETDYYKFNLNDVKLAEKTLYSVLTDKKIMINDSYKKYLDFLL